LHFRRNGGLIKRRELREDGQREQDPGLQRYHVTGITEAGVMPPS